MKFLRENLCFSDRSVDLFLEYLCATLEHLYGAGFSDVAYPVALVVSHDALGADHYLIVLAEVLALLLRVAHAILNLWSFLSLAFFGARFFLLDLLHQNLSFLVVEVVKDREVFDQLLDVWREVGAAGRAGEDVARAQVHEAVLAERVPAGEDARDLVLVVVVVVADRTSHLHLVLLF